MLTSIRHTQLKNVVSHDKLRPAMMGVLYDPENERIVATNGHVLVVYSVQPDENDQGCILPVDAFDNRGITTAKQPLRIDTSNAKETILYL